MVNIPVTAQATKLGFTTLADLQMLGLEYQHTGLAVTQALISSQPELVRNLIESVRRGDRLLQNASQKVHRDLAKVPEKRRHGCARGSLRIDRSDAYTGETLSYS